MNIKNEPNIHKLIISISYLDVKQFNALDGCMKCLVKGKYSDISNAVAFTAINAELRTDEAFRSGVYGKYHHGPTPLTDLEIDMILDFPVGDELHLIDLGVTKRFLESWKNGKPMKSLKWSEHMKSEISQYLKSIKRPLEIHREIRGIDELAYWKGTEYRTFLLYTCIVVLKKYLPLKFYQHFLLYFCSITICSTEYHMDILHIAEEMLKSFLEHFKVLYGAYYCVSNIHNLCHLVEEVRRFGPLITFSAYPFESKLHNLKMKLRTGTLPLSQIGKRLLEEELISNRNFSQEKKRDTLRKKKSNFEPNLNQFFPHNTFSVYEEIELGDFVLNTSEGDRYFLTFDLEIIQIKYIILNVHQNNKLYLYGSAFQSWTDFFCIPFPSRGLNIYQTDYKLCPASLYPIESIKAKMFAVPYAGDYNDNDEDEEDILTEPRKIVFIPLIHTLK